MQTESKWVVGDGGVKIHVVDYGGEGPPLVLCHCTGTFARVWDPVVARLRGAFHVYAPDSRGQGDSERPADAAGFDWAFSGRDLLCVIDALGLAAGIFAAGHSAGGAQVGYAELFRPGTFAKMMWLDAIISPRDALGDENPLAAAVRRRKNIFENVEAARARFSAKPPMNSWHPEALEAYLAHAFQVQPDGQIVLKCPGDVEALVYEGGGAYDLFERLGEIETPVQVVASGSPFEAALAEMQMHRLKNCDYVQIEELGHFMPQEDPDRVAAMLRAWFG